MDDIKDSTFIVLSDEARERLDIFLAKKLAMSRSQAQKLIDRGYITVNGKQPKKAGDHLTAGAAVVIDVAEATHPPSAFILTRPPTPSLVKKGGERGELVEVIADTPYYIVIDKPAGLLVHPTEAREPVSLSAWLKERYPEIVSVGESPDRPGIVHRLDKEASGLLVIARTQAMYEHLKKQFQARTIDKEYAVLAHGVISQDHDIISFDIDRGSNGRMVARPKVKEISLRTIGTLQDGKEAVTEFFVDKRFARYTLLTVKLHTGRTHQIRVHLLAYNHPVVGDTLYYNPKLNRKRDLELGRLFLHAKKFCFNDLSGERQCFTAGLPTELHKFLLGLR